MKRLVREAGLEGAVEVDSAGTGAWHIGERADPRMRQAAEARGLTLTSRARQLAAEDFERFDLILAMDRDNLRNIRTATPTGGGRPTSAGPAEITERGDTRLLSSFLDASWPEDVPDPYYGGAAGFERVIDMLEAACPAVLDALVAG